MYTNLIRNLKKVRPEIWLILILIFALILRMYFFVGLVSSDPQDDGIYYNNAFAIYKNRFDFSRYKNIGEDYLANPAETFYFRIMVIYPISFLFHIFGPGEYSAGMWSLICSLGTIVCTFYLGKYLINVKTGLFSSFLLSIFPLDTIYSTRILPDIVLAFFVVLSLVFFVKALEKNSKYYYLISGLSLGFAYLTKITALIILPVMLLAFIFHCYKKSKMQKWVAFFILGFLVVFSLESLYFYSQTGEPLLHYKIEKSSVRFKYTYEDVGKINLGFLKVNYNTGTPIYHLRNIFGLGTHTENVNLFGFFYFIAVAGIILSILKKRNYLLILWFFLVLLYFEFGFIDLSFNEGINYYMIFKDPRFLAILSPVVVILSSYFLIELKKWNNYIFLILMFFLILSSFVLINQDYKFYRGSMSDLREASEFVKENPNTIFYSDYLAINNVNIFTYHKMKNLISINKETEEKELKNSYIILGGSGD